uniref:Uncharacterized protein n=1 Tax=Romanomermis culicivorax TaxID=13658 RepID=A0A915K1H6_ROMCU
MIGSSNNKQPVINRRVQRLMALKECNCSRAMTIASTGGGSIKSKSIKLFIPIAFNCSKCILVLTYDMYTILSRLPHRKGARAIHLSPSLNPKPALFDE